MILQRAAEEFRRGGVALAFLPLEVLGWSQKGEDYGVGRQLVLSVTALRTAQLLHSHPRGECVSTSALISRSRPAISSRQRRRGLR